MTHMASATCVPGTFGRMRAALVAYAARLMDPDTAEDLVQEAFVRAMESRRPDLHELPVSYFKAIVHNLAMDVFWKRSRDRVASERMGEAAALGRMIERSSDGSPLDADIQERLSELSQRQWESLILTVVKGMTERQAASAVDVSRSAVTGSRERALQSLREGAKARDQHAAERPGPRAAPPAGRLAG